MGGKTGPGGGKVFYYSASGFTMTDTGEICHYLEAAPDYMGFLEWASSKYIDKNIDDTETEIGTGRKNTALILAVDANAPAAKACKEYNGGGKNDWFLPSREELDVLYVCRKYIGMENADYWSSSQSYIRDLLCALFQHFGRGVRGAPSFYNNGVRAIRAF